MALRASLEAAKKESLKISKMLKSQHNKDRRTGTPAKDKRTKEKSKKGKGKGNDDPWAWKIFRLQRETPIQRSRMERSTTDESATKPEHCTFLTSARRILIT